MKSLFFHFTWHVLVGIKAERKRGMVLSLSLDGGLVLYKRNSAKEKCSEDFWNHKTEKAVGKLCKI